MPALRRSLVQLFLLVFPLGGLMALELPPSVKDAVVLELGGHAAEALDRYRAALSTETALIDDESTSRPLTILVLSKAAHLSIDLGLGEEASDLAARLLAARNRPAVEAGTLVRLRLLRLQGRTAEAQSLFDAFSKDGPPGPDLLTEAARLRPGKAAEAALKKSGAPASQVLGGDWLWLSGPSEAFGLQVQETTRLQVGVFRDWGNALTLVDMLREKGWSPLTEVRLGADGAKLHVVYVVSRQPASDKARLEAQGLLN